MSNKRKVFERLEYMHSIYKHKIDLAWENLLRMKFPDAESIEVLNREVTMTGGKYSKEEVEAFMNEIVNNPKSLEDLVIEQPRPKRGRLINRIGNPPPTER